MRTARFFCIGLLFSLVACGGQSSSEELKSVAQTAASWAATAQLAGEAWLGDATPERYTFQTLQSAEQAVRKEDDTLQQAGTAEGNAAKLESCLQQLAELIADMAAAIEQHDRDKLSGLIQQLRDKEQQLSTLMKELERA